MPKKKCTLCPFFQKISLLIKRVVRALGGVNLTNFGRDLKPGFKVILDLLKQGINCWDRSIYFIVPEN